MLKRIVWFIIISSTIKLKDNSKEQDKLRWRIKIFARIVIFSFMIVIWISSQSKYLKGPLKPGQAGKECQVWGLNPKYQRTNIDKRGRRKVTLYTRQLSFKIFYSFRYYYTLIILISLILTFDIQALNLKVSSVFLFIDQVTFSFISEMNRSHLSVWLLELLVRTQPLR